MQFNKSYRLLRYMNQPHNIVERHALASLAWLGVMGCTRSPVLAASLFRQFRQDRFDIAFRKCARFARLLSPRLDVFNDPFFDFTRDTAENELRALERTAIKCKRYADENSRLTDLLYIKGARIHALLESGDQSKANDEIAIYYKIASEILENLNNPIVGTGVLERNKLPPADFSREDGVQALTDITELLPIDQWPWFVMSGTFLGLHRENGFLGHDYDIDLGIHAEQVNLNDLLAHLQKQNVFALKKVDHHLKLYKDAYGQRFLDKKLSLIKLVHRNGLHIDIFVHYTEGSQCWHGSIIHRWQNTPFALVRRNMEGVTVNAPENADVYLTENYGDWRTPVRNFDCTTGTPNLVISRNFISLALFLKRLDYFTKYDGPQARKLIGMLESTNVLVNDGSRLALKIDL